MDDFPEIEPISKEELLKKSLAALRTAPTEEIRANILKYIERLKKDIEEDD